MYILNVEVENQDPYSMALQFLQIFFFQERWLDELCAVFHFNSWESAR